MAERKPWFPEALGTTATVVCDNENGEPRTVSDEAKSDWRDVGPGYMDDLSIVSVWSFHIALYALQNPTPENVERALALIGTSGDVEEWADSDTLLPLAVPPPDGWASHEKAR